MGLNPELVKIARHRVKQASPPYTLEENLAYYGARPITPEQQALLADPHEGPRVRKELEAHFAKPRPLLGHRPHIDEIFHQGETRRSKMAPTRDFIAQNSASTDKAVAGAEQALKNPLGAVTPSPAPAAAAGPVPPKPVTTSVPAPAAAVAAAEAAPVASAAPGMMRGGLDWMRANKGKTALIGAGLAAAGYGASRLMGGREEKPKQASYDPARLAYVLERIKQAHAQALPTLTRQ